MKWQTRYPGPQSKPADRQRRPCRGTSRPFTQSDTAWLFQRPIL